MSRLEFPELAPRSSFIKTAFGRGRRTFRRTVGKLLATRFGEDVCREDFKREATGQNTVLRHAPGSIGLFAAEKDAVNTLRTDFARAEMNSVA
jgi:hypothetical protein